MYDFRINIIKERLQLRMMARADLAIRALGGVLCLAAASKLLSAFTSQSTKFELVSVTVASVVEAVVGAALVLHLRPSISLPAGGLLFVLLAGVSWIGTIRGAARCGCLGAVSVPPWILLILDVGAAAALLWRSLSSSSWSEKQVVALVLACISNAYIGMAVGSVLFPRLGVVTSALSPEAIQAANTVIIRQSELQPGHPFPLLPYIRIDDDLSRGNWKVILAKAGCSRCEQRLRGSECQPESDERVAVILAKVQTGWTLPESCKAVLGWLSSDKDWTFEAPLIIRLVDGRVSPHGKADSKTWR
jgi:hypothetical protein